MSKHKRLVQTKGWFLRLKAVGNQPGDQMSHEIDGAAMTGVFNLRDVLELINDGFNDGALTQQQLVAQQHQLVFHVGLELGDQFDPLLAQLLPQRSGEIALVARQLAEQALDQSRNRLAVIDIARGQAQRQQFAAIVDQQVKLETEESAHGGLAACCPALKDAMAGDAPVLADRQGRRVNEGNPSAGAETQAQKDT